MSLGFYLAPRAMVRDPTSSHQASSVDLAVRSVKAERMDDPALDASKHRSALRGLSRLNAWSRTTSHLARTIQAIVESRSLREFRVLDVASGGGENLRALARRFSETYPQSQWLGCDISPTAVDEANRAAQSERVANCQFAVHDIFEQSPTSRYDVVLCTLFMHHLSEGQACQLLSTLASITRHAVVIDDLVRSSRGYWLAQLGCRLLSRSPIVHYDGPVSVQAAFTPAEALQLARKVGLHDATLRKHWPERFTLEWRCPPQ